MKPTLRALGPSVLGTSPWRHVPRVIESIPYLKQLGITSLELRPIQEFDEFENPRSNPRTGERLTNYWGYSTIAFFSPKAGYSSDESLSGPVREFKEMVRALHKAGIEVILDIVFNHTAEGNERGVTMGFRGLDNPIYYMLEDNRRYYRNYSGCGNTVNCNHPVVRSFILDCLRYWVTEMHVDGFRFDLGSILEGISAAGSSRIPPCWSESRRTRSSGIPRSSRRLGTRAEPIRWAGFPAAAGPSGTTAFATTSARSGAGIPAPFTTSRRG
jgi:hypothetical protein